MAAAIDAATAAAAAANNDNDQDAGGGSDSGVNDSGTGKDGDGKGGAGDGADARASSGSDDGTPGAPSEYAAFKSQDGYELTEDGLAEAHKMFKGMNLTQEQAQQFMDHNFSTMVNAEQTARDDIAQAQATADTAALKAWDKEIEGDSVFGGEHLKQTHTSIASFIKAFGEGEGGAVTRQQLEAVNLHRWPPLMKLLANGGVHFNEGEHGGGDPTAIRTENRQPHEIVYDERGMARNHNIW